MKLLVRTAYLGGFGINSVPLPFLGQALPGEGIVHISLVRLRRRGRGLRNHTAYWSTGPNVLHI